MRTLLCSLVCLSGICCQALAAPSGLNVIPTADVLDRGVLSLETESAGAGRPWSDGCDQYNLLQIGLGNGVEFGIDRCVDSSSVWLNAKWQVAKDPAAAAIGIQGAGEKAQPYLVVSKESPLARVHGGFIGMEGRWRWMLGLDKALGDRIALQADYVSGRENSLSLGMALTLNRTLAVTFARSLANSGQSGSGHIINLAWLIER